MKPARPDNAPGYKCKRNADGTWREYWACRDDIRRRDFMPAYARLYFDPTSAGREVLAARCTRLQGEMLAWAASGGEYPRSGTVASPTKIYLIRNGH